MDLSATPVRPRNQSSIYPTPDSTPTSSCDGNSLLYYVNSEHNYDKKCSVLDKWRARILYGDTENSTTPPEDLSARLQKQKAVFKVLFPFLTERQIHGKALKSCGVAATPRSTRLRPSVKKNSTRGKRVKTRINLLDSRMSDNSVINIYRNQNNTDQEFNIENQPIKKYKITVNNHEVCNDLVCSNGTNTSSCPNAFDNYSFRHSNYYIANISSVLNKNPGNTIPSMGYPSPQQESIVQSGTLGYNLQSVSNMHMSKSVMYRNFQEIPSDAETSIDIDGSILDVDDSLSNASYQFSNRNSIYQPIYFQQPSDRGIDYERKTCDGFQQLSVCYNNKWSMNNKLDSDSERFLNSQPMLLHQEIDYKIPDASHSENGIEKMSNTVSISETSQNSMFPGLTQISIFSSQHKNIENMYIPPSLLLSNRSSEFDYSHLNEDFKPSEYSYLKSETELKRYFDENIPVDQPLCQYFMSSDTTIEDIEPVVHDKVNDIIDFLNDN